MRFGLDFDGVCYKWSATARLLIRYHWGVDVGESLTWDHIQNHAPHHAWEWLWTDGVEKHGLFRHGNCYPDTFEALDDLAASGWDLVVVTSRPANALVDTLGWLSYHQIPAREVHILGAGVKKSSIPCDLYVDDAPKNVLDTAEAGHRSLLWTRPWNMDFDDWSEPGSRQISRVEKWSDVLWIAKEMKR